LLAASDPHVVAIATDAPESMQIEIPVFDLRHPEMIAEFIWTRFVGSEIDGTQLRPLPAEGCI
jgi:hypothetical protein